MKSKAWMPKLMHPYWSIQENHASDAPELRVYFVKEWQETFYELLMYRAGLVFKTAEEAESVLPTVAAEFDWGYQLKNEERARRHEF